MSLYVDKVKIFNFLTFFGLQEVNLRPFTTIVCHFDQGKEDMCRAFEFVFGASLAEMNVNTALDLLHKGVRNHVTNSKNCFVQVTVNVAEERKITFSRCVRNGTIEYEIDHKIVSALKYGDTLDSLNLNIRHKNLIIHKHYFNDIMWGTPEQMEMRLVKILREDCCIDEWKKASQQIKCLKDVQRLFSDGKFLDMEKSHGAVEKFVKSINAFLVQRDKFYQMPPEEGVQEDPLLDETSVESTVFPLPENISHLEENETLLVRQYNLLKDEVSKLTSKRYCLAVEIASKNGDNSILE